MKNFAAILAITVIVLGMTPSFSYADVNTDREAWDHIELGSVGLQNDGSVSDDYLWLQSKGESMSPGLLSVIIPA